MTEQPIATAPDTGGLIDLNAGRAARREGKNQHVRVTIGTTTIELPVEFPLDALSPLRDINLDFGLVVGSKNPEQTLRDLVVAQPQLVVEAIDAGKAVLEGLLCSCGAYEENLLLRASLTSLEGAVDKVPHSDGTPDTDSGPPTTVCSWVGFVRERPSTQDLIALGRGLATVYGVDLGEALTSSDSAGNGGTTSKQTSGGTTSSMPARRGGSRAKGRRPAAASASGG